LQPCQYHFLDITSKAQEEKESFGGILRQMRSVHFEAQYFYEAMIGAILTKDEFTWRIGSS
jgi:hypothetical protein